MPKLTESVIRGFAIESGRQDRMMFDTVCPGLGVRVTAKGTKTFLTQWTDPVTKRKQREPLGVWPALTLDGARAATRVKLGDVAMGVNPRVKRLKAKADADRQRSEEALTFDRLITDWVRLHLSKRRPRYAAEAERAIRLAFHDMINKPAARITKDQVVNRLDEMIKAKKLTTAGRTRAYARAAFNWALKRGRISDNPFGDLPIATPSAERERVLSTDETREVWAAAGAMPAPYGQFIRMALLTLARRDEVAGLRWSELTLERSEWTIPGARTKNGKPHIVHLSIAALEVLSTLPRIEDQDLVFSTTGRSPISGFSSFKRALDGNILVARAKRAHETGKGVVSLEPFVLHDFRRTGVSTLAALGFDSIVADKLLNHQPAKLRGVAAVYQRHEFGPERARALDAWAEFCTQKATPGENVVPIGKAG